MKCHNGFEGHTIAFNMSQFEDDSNFTDSSSLPGPCKQLQS